MEHKGAAVISRVVAIVGSYREGETIDTAVEAILQGARARGSETHTIYLRKQHLKFCTNCRQCAQVPGLERGICVLGDDLEHVLNDIETADSLVVGSPVNHGNVTALSRLFLERLTGYGYWPWGQAGPRPRKRVLSRRAVLVASAAIPGLLIPLLTGTSIALRNTAQLLGAKTVDKLWIGMAAREKHQSLSAHTIERARRMGMKLA